LRDAWLAAHTGVNAFGGRASLTSRLSRILLNHARTRAGREARLIGLANPGSGAWDQRAVPLLAFQQLWKHVVLVLRGLEGCTGEDACALPGITTESQRVLLHRARRIRTTVDALWATHPRRRRGQLH